MEKKQILDRLKGWRDVYTKKQEKYQENSPAWKAYEKTIENLNRGITNVEQGKYSVEQLKENFPYEMSTDLPLS